MKYHFKLLRAIKDEVTCQLKYEFELNIIGGKKITVHLKPAEISTFHSFANTLNRFGIFLSRKSPEDRKSFSLLQQRTKNLAVVETVNQTGWRQEDFVMPRHIIGKNKKKLLGPKYGLARKKGEPHMRGTLSDWQSGILPARNSSTALACIAAAFAAPTLVFTDVSSFSLWISGPVKSGINTSLLAGASVVGFGDERDLPAYPRTDAAITELAEQFRDYMLPLYETHPISDAAANRYLAMQRFGHLISKEGSKRASKHSVVRKSTGRIEHVRTIVVAAGQQSAAELAQDVSKSRADACRLRIYDLQMLDDPDSDIFDFLKPTERREEIFRNQCQRIEAAARENHGCALKAFVEAIQANPLAAKKALYRFRKEFLSKYTNSDDDPVLLSCAESFAHLYSALRYAIELKIAPFGPNRARIAIHRCYRRARRAARHDELVAERAYARFLTELHSMKLKQVRSQSELPPKTYDGFIDLRKPKKLLVLRGEVLKQIFPNDRDATLLLALLHKENRLTSGSNPPALLKTSILWAETQTYWADHERVRSVIFKPWH